MNHIIYKATHIMTGRVKYIGITHQELRKRIAGHRNNKKSLIYEDMCKDLLEFEVIDTATDFLEALGKESFYISKYDTLFPNGANQVKSRRYIEGIEQQQLEAQEREQRKLRRRGIVRGFPSLEMPVGSWYRQYRNQRFIDYVTAQKDMQYQSFVMRCETQKNGLRNSYIPSVLTVAPWSTFWTDQDRIEMTRRGIDTSLFQTTYKLWQYHDRHGEWYGGKNVDSRRPLSPYTWDWIYDIIDKMNKPYLEMRTWESCEVLLPIDWATSAPILQADNYYYAISVDDYLAGRKS